MRKQIIIGLFLVSDLPSLAKTLRRKLRGPVIKLFIRAFAGLPLPMAHRLGAALGGVFYAFNGKLRQVTEINLRFCFPALTNKQRDALCRVSLREAGKGMAEVGLLWQGTRERVFACVQTVHGAEIMREAVAAGRGVLVIAPHLGAWELVGLHVSNQFPMTSMYRPPRVPELNTLMRTSRERFGARLVPTDTSGVRAQLVALKNGEVVGVLPDQDPGENNSNFAPFFGVPANTATLVPRLLNKTGCQGVFVFAVRLPQGRGFDLHFEPMPEDANHADLAVALTAINDKVEQIARRFPEQYLWSYERFRVRPDKGADPYA